MPSNIAQDVRSIWLSPDDSTVVQVIDQRLLPHDYCIHNLRYWRDGLIAIREMYVRGAPLIGATAAWSLYLASLDAGDPAAEIELAADELLNSRPTAVNLRWAVERVLSTIAAAGENPDLAALTRHEAEAICDEDIAICRAIGAHGLSLIEEISTRRNGAPVNILTHCNAGSLATVSFGTATAPIYLAHEKGIAVHVLVDETRPRNQGSQLTAWELATKGVPHTLIVDNAGGHLMQRGQVDLVITGTDRTTRHGDVANKIGTYLKALAASDNGVPFYVALPSTTIDWRTRDGLQEITIEERDALEVTHTSGTYRGQTISVRTAAPGTAVKNPAFDVTPARLVTGLITERGVCAASEEGLLQLFPEMRDH